jgi:hypothetical protein
MIRVGRDLIINNVGNFSVHNESSDKGVQLAEFGVTRNVMISSVVFPYRRRCGYLTMVLLRIKLII